MRSVLFAVMLFSFSVFAQTEIKTQIHDIDMGGPGDEPLIYLTTGQVVSFPSAEISQMTVLKEAITSRKWFLIKINSQREITSYEMTLPEMQTSFSPKSSFKNKMMTEEFSPSILKNLDAARSFFYDARTDANKDSQCYNRAHVWSYEWRTKRNLYSSKAWVFFTRRFIRKYKFEWWFHVAPMVHVVIDHKVKERVMDIKYARGPLSLKQWTNIFMRDNADCPVVDKYTDQANFPESGSCFLMKSSMYYYQPVDLEQLEITGIPKTMWLEGEVKHAYTEAFTPKPETTEEQPVVVTE